MDYEITCINKDKNNTIVEIGARTHKLTFRKIYGKQEFIDLIEEFKKYPNIIVTIKTIKGTDVNIVKDKYLRTDSNEIEEDNLDELDKCK